MNTNKRRFITKPWIPETIVFFAVLWQESVRLSLRTAKRELPIARWLQDFYYFNFGDFVNGYVIAYLIDGITELASNRARPENDQPGISILGIPRVVVAVCATVLSGLIVIAFELGIAPLTTTSDINDIPAGLGGAMLYCFVRLVALRFTHIP